METKFDLRTQPLHDHDGTMVPMVAIEDGEGVTKDHGPNHLLQVTGRYRCPQCATVKEVQTQLITTHRLDVEGGDTAWTHK